jgi:integrase/recombinase XerD
MPLPPAVGRAIDRAIGNRTRGPVLLNSRGTRLDRHAATRRLRHLAGTAGIHIARAHPHMLCHTFVTTMQGRGVASVATFRARHEDGAVRDSDPDTAGGDRDSRTNPQAREP